MGKRVLLHAANALIRGIFKPPDWQCLHGAARGALPQEKSHTCAERDSRASSSLPPGTVFVNKRPARFKLRSPPDCLSRTMLLQAASKPDNHFRNKMEIRGLIFANIINSFFAPLPLLPLSTMSRCIPLNCCQP